QAVSIAATYCFIDRLPELFIWMLRGSSFSVDTILVFQFALALLTILPPTFAGGALFPLTLRIVTSGLGRVGRDVGRAYAANTIGAIAGSFAAGFVVLPLLGLEHGILLAAGLCLFLCTMLILVAPDVSVRRRVLLVAAPALAAALGLHLPRWNRVFFQSGLF